MTFFLQGLVSHCIFCMCLRAKLGLRYQKKKKKRIVFLCASHCTQLHTTDKYFKLFKQLHLQRAPHSSAEYGGFNFKYLSKWWCGLIRFFFFSFFFKQIHTLMHVEKETP